MSPCPSEFALDDYHLHAGDRAVAAHLGDCARCQARMAERRRVSDEFRAGPAAATLPRLLAVRPRSARLRLLWAPMGVALAAACLLLLIRPGEERYQGIKGGAALRVVRQRGTGGDALQPGDRVQAGDRLRFIPTAPPGARYVYIGSVDGGGRFSAFYPAGSDQSSVPLPSPGEPLDGSIVLDDAPGPERLFALFSPHPLSAVEVRRAVEARAPTVLWFEVARDH